MLVSYIRRSLNATICYSTSILIIRGINFLILPYFLTKLTLTDFGIWDFYQLFFTLGGHLVAGTASQIITRYYVLTNHDPKRRQQAVGNACLVAAILAFGLLIGGLLMLWLFGALHNIYAVNTLFTCFFWSLFSVTLSEIRIREKLGLYVTLFTGQALLATLLTVMGVMYGFGIEAFFYANLASCACLSPIFIMLTLRYRAYSFPLLQEQLHYALPIVVQSMQYTGFFTIDRLIIKYGAGYQVLGEYALLWRFGALFQFFSIALLDTWFIMIYNAHNEERSDFLLNRLMVFFFVLLTSGSLAAMAGSRFLISILFPNTYHNLISYLVIFFVSLTIVECARLMQAGSFLSTKTRMLPAITMGALCLQGVLLILLYPYGLWGIFAANTATFSIYALSTAWQTQRTYHAHILPKQRLGKIIACFLAYAMLLQLLFCFYASWYYIALLAITWPLTQLVTHCVESDEKRWMYEQYRLRIKPLLKKA